MPAANAACNASIARASSRSGAVDSRIAPRPRTRWSDPGHIDMESTLPIRPVPRPMRAIYSPVMPQDRGLLRTRHGHAHHRVGFVELFFDLVFVFAVTQLSHLLIEHFSFVGALETALLTLAVWWVWI